MPGMRSRLQLYDHQPERRWRHLDTCQYQTILHAEPPRAECREHGVKVVKLPWAEPSSRFAALFEGLAIEAAYCSELEKPVTGNGFSQRPALPT